MPAKRPSRRAGRPRSFRADEALDQATRVFWEKGFEGTSMAALVAATGLKPASLYAAFGNKEALFRKVLDRYLATNVAFVQRAIHEPTALAVAGQLLYQTAEFLTRPGCPRGCLTLQALSCGDDALPVHDCLIELRRNSLEVLRRRFQKALRDGDLPPDADPGDLARFVTAVYQGMSVQAVGGARRKELMGIANTALRAWPTGRGANAPVLPGPEPQRLKRASSRNFPA